MATMKDVAEKAGVALSTVSYVISGARPISDATRALIVQAMEDLDFRPNVVAQALAGRRTKVIALLLAPAHRAVGLSELAFVREATEAAKALDHHLVLLSEGMDSEADLAHLKSQGLVDGVILMEVHLRDPRVKLLQRLGLPFSLIGRQEPVSQTAFADIDFDRTFREILEYLAGLGHQRIGFINQSRQAWEAGYGPVVRAQSAFDNWRPGSGRLSSLFCASTPRAGWKACHDLLARPPAPTALVVMNDRALPGVLQALAAQGLKVPEDVSLVSAVTSPTAAELMIPALTSADAPSRELARLAVGNLVRSIENPREILESVLVPCRLTPRESTSHPPKEAP